MSAEDPSDLASLAEGLRREVARSVELGATNAERIKAIMETIAETRQHKDELRRESTTIQVTLAELKSLPSQMDALRATVSSYQARTETEFRELRREMASLGTDLRRDVVNQVSTIDDRIEEVERTLQRRDGSLSVWLMLFPVFAAVVSGTIVAVVGAWLR